MSTSERALPDEPRVGASIASVVNDRLTGRFELDAAGFDRQLAGALRPLAGLRWSVHVDGLDLLPRGPALVVHSRRVGASEGVVLATALAGHGGRAVRLVGGVDVAPLSTAALRLGWIPPTTADLRAALRAGRTPVLGLERSLVRRFRAGTVDPALVQAAIDTSVPIVPAAVVGREVGRRWVVVLGAPVAVHAGGIVDADALAERVRERVDQLLEAAKPRHLPF